MKKSIIYISIALNLLLVAILIYICGYKTDLSHRFYAKLTHQVYVPVRHDVDCVNSWNICVCQLDYKVDVAFFGDSHISCGNWQQAFPNMRVVNLGYIGEDTKGMLRRVEQIKSVNPNKVIVMAGINGLKNQTEQQFETYYTRLIDSISMAVPDASIYVESLLPVSRFSNFCPNSKIVQANEYIKRYAEQHNCTFVDIYSLYSSNGVLPDGLTEDGLHLKQGAYQRWYDFIRSYIEEQISM